MNKMQNNKSKRDVCDVFLKERVEPARTGAGEPSLEQTLLCVHSPSRLCIVAALLTRPSPGGVDPTLKAFESTAMTFIPGTSALVWVTL